MKTYLNENLFTFISEWGSTFSLTSLSIFRARAALVVRASSNEYLMPKLYFPEFLSYCRVFKIYMYISEVERQYVKATTENATIRK